VNRIAHIIVILLLSCASILAQSSPFLDFIKQRILREPKPRGAQRISFDSICSFERNPLARRVLFEYGSIFVSTTDVRIPGTCIFSDSDEVDGFQSKLKTKRALIANTEIELQTAAMEQLERARAEGMRAGLRISPLDGRIAGARNYDDTVRIWNSRFHRALNHWVQMGKISSDEAAKARSAAIRKQVDMVIAWESKGYYFSTNFSKSIFYSVAPPGTSQHLSLLAFDVVESGNPSVRRLLNKYGWFQTIRTDQPHFTFLGVAESELPRRGLKNIIHQGNSYWVPNADIRPVVALNETSLPN
jgi:hypothetical protein